MDQNTTPLHQVFLLLLLLLLIFSPLPLRRTFFHPVSAVASASPLLPLGEERKRKQTKTKQARLVDEAAADER